MVDPKDPPNAPRIAITRWKWNFDFGPKFAKTRNFGRKYAFWHILTKFGPKSKIHFQRIMAILIL